MASRLFIIDRSHNTFLDIAEKITCALSTTKRGDPINFVFVFGLRTANDVKKAYEEIKKSMETCEEFQDILQPKDRLNEFCHVNDKHARVCSCKRCTAIREIVIQAKFCRDVSRRLFVEVEQFEYIFSSWVRYYRDDPEYVKDSFSRSRPAMLQALQNLTDKIFDSRHSLRKGW